MKSNNIFKKVIIIVFCIGLLNSCKKEYVNNTENNNIEISKVKVSDILTGGSSESSSRISKLAYRVFPNINLFPVGGPASRFSGSETNNLQTENSITCPIRPGFLYNMSLASSYIGYDCNGAAEANFIVGAEYINGEPPGGVFASINGIQFPAQRLSYFIADAQAYLVANVPYIIIGNPCQFNTVSIGLSSGAQVCGATNLLLVNYNMPPTGGGQNGGSWTPGTGYTTVIGRAILTVPIVICYNNPCFPGQAPFTNYTFRYKLQNTTTWTEVTATYFQTQIGYTINNLPAGVYNLEGRDSASNPWVTGFNGGVFTVL